MNTHSSTAAEKRPKVPGGTRFITYLAGVGMSLLGSQAWFVALAWAASQLGNARSVSLVMAVAAIPRAVLILPAGAFVDHWGARKVALGSDFMRMSTMAAAAIALASLQPGLMLLLIVGAIFGIIDALHIPALGSLPPRLLPRSQLAAGQGLLQTVQRAASVAAAPLGGLVLAVAGLPWTLAINSVLFGAAYVLLRFTVPSDRLQSGSLEQSKASTVKKSPISPLLDGWKTAWNDGAMRGILITVCILNLASNGALNIGLVQLANENSWGAQGFGLLTASFAAGAVVGSLLVSAAKPAEHPVRSGLIWTTIGGVSIIAIGFCSHFIEAIIFASTLGISMGPASALLLGTVQARCPEQYLGRVMSLVGFSAVGLAPISMIAFGQISDRTNMMTAFLASGIALAATSIVALLIPSLRNVTQR